MSATTAAEAVVSGSLTNGVELIDEVAELVPDHYIPDPTVRTILKLVREHRKITGGVLDRPGLDGLLADANAGDYAVITETFERLRGQSASPTRVRGAAAELAREHLRRTVAGVIRDGSDILNGSVTEELPDGVPGRAWAGPEDAREWLIERARELAADAERDAGEAPNPPTPLDAAERPPFPVEALPEPLRRFVTELAEATQTPADLAALMTFGALGTLVGGRVWICTRPGWTESLNFWGLVVMASGSRKSPVVAAVTRPLHRIERDAAADAELRRPAIEQRRTIAETRAANLAKAASAEDATPEVIEQATEARQMADRIEVPAVPRLLAGDITPEATATLLAEQGGRLGVIDSEGGLFGTLLGRYSSGMVNMDTFLKGYSGDATRVDRQGRSLLITRPTLTLALAVQDDVLRELGSRPEARGRGLPARFLLAVPTPTVGRRKIAPDPVSEQVEQDWAELLATLARFPTPADDDDTPRLVLDPAAQAELIEFERALEPRLDAHTGDLAGIRDWASKLVGTVARLAGLLHLAGDPRMPDPLAPTLIGEPNPGIVTAQTVRAAIEIGRWAVPHALIAFGALGRRRDTGPAAALLRWIIGRRDPYAEVSTRAAWQSVKGRAAFPDTASVEAALHVLVDHDYLIRVVEDGPKRPGRPRAPRFRVNPLTPTPKSPRTSLSAPGTAPGTPTNDCGGLDGSLGGALLNGPATHLSSTNGSSGGSGGICRGVPEMEGQSASPDVPPELPEAKPAPPQTPTNGVRWAPTPPPRGGGSS